MIPFLSQLEMFINDIISYENVEEIISLKYEISVGNMDESRLDVTLINYFSKLLTNSSNFMQYRIEIDMFRHCIDYSFNKGFSALQLSNLLSILVRIHACCIHTVYDNLAQTQLLFKDLLHQCSLTHIPFSNSLFSTEQCLSVIDYFTLAYFSHFHLYKFVFSSESSLQLHVLYSLF